jgi:hypothetical protein
VKISGVDFEGPYSVDSTVILRDRAAVYVIICRKTNGDNVVMDVGESGEVGVRIALHPRRSCWERNCSGTLHVYLRYMPTSEGYDAASRRALEAKIRREYTPPCGKV